MGKRRRARELALQALYQADFHGPEAEEPLQEFWKSQRVAAETASYAHYLFDGVQASRKRIDELIKQNSEHWRVDRMSRVDRNILRLAVFELLSCPDVPARVIIDEAVEIAKRYGAEGSSAFINGILDPIAKKIGRREPGEQERAEQDS